MADQHFVTMLYRALTVTLVLLSVANSQDNTVCLQNQYQPGVNGKKKPEFSGCHAGRLTICKSPCVTGRKVGLDPPKPSLPDMYEVGIECNIQDRKFTTDYKEYYDQQGKRAAIHIYQGGYRREEVYSFATNELFSIDRTSNVCRKQNLTSASDLTLFGAKSGTTGKAQIFTAYGALHFGQNINEKWNGSKMIRGINCDKWSSCVYWKEKNATMVVDWYFSKPDWHTTENQTQVPVRAHVKGNIWTGSKSRPFEHTYELYDFRTNVKRQTEFETPSGAFCPGRKDTRPIPTPPPTFHFTSELLKTDTNQISRIKEWYDFNMFLVRYEYQPFNDKDPYGTDLQMQIHDFNTGVAYVIDKMRGNCTVTAISNTGFDTRNDDASHVRIRTSKEFFNMDKSKYTYEGTKSARGILCDVWIGQRTDWPHPNSNITSTFQWFFATSSYNRNYQDKPTFGMPIMMTINGQDYGHYEYNIYGYDELQPNVFDFDVSRCYNFTAKKDILFYLPGSFRDLASTNYDAVKYGVVNALRSIIPGLSVLRINNIQIDYSGQNDIVVRFTLLDKAPVPGDVLNPKTQPDLATAVSNITQAINHGRLVVKFQAKTSQRPVAIIAGNYTNVGDHVNYTVSIVTNYLPDTSTASGYSGGAMAGLGVAMLVVFFILGVAAMYIYYRKLGGAFLPKKFDNEDDITKDTT